MRTTENGFAIRAMTLESNMFRNTEKRYSENSCALKKRRISEVTEHDSRNSTVCKGT